MHHTTAISSDLRPTSVLPGRTELTPRRFWLSGRFVLASDLAGAHVRARGQARTHTHETLGRTVGR